MFEKLDLFRLFAQTTTFFSIVKYDFFQELDGEKYVSENYSSTLQTLFGTEGDDAARLENLEKILELLRANKAVCPGKTPAVDEALEKVNVVFNDQVFIFISWVKREYPEACNFENIHSGNSVYHQMHTVIL